MQNHTLKEFDNELDRLTEAIKTMSKTVESASSDAVTALLNQDRQLATRAIGATGIVRTLHRRVDDQAIQMIVRRQPMAIDLREIVGAFKTARNLERIASLAENVAETATMIDSAPSEPCKYLQRVLGHTLTQLRATMTAYFSGDSQGAIAALSSAREVDFVCAELAQALDTFTSSDSRNIVTGIQLALCAAALQGMSEYVSRIAETAYYVVEGCTPIEHRLAETVPLVVAAPCAPQDVPNSSGFGERSDRPAFRDSAVI